MTLFHLTTEAAWAEAQRLGEYRAPSLASEGFIHLSTAAQWRRTAQRFFLGQSGLVLLEIDSARLTAEVRFEQADGEAFPHLYGPLELAAVTRVQGLTVDARGVGVTAPSALPAR